MFPVFCALAACIAVPKASFADRGALSLDVGAGGSMLALPAPYAPSSPSALGSSFTTSLGLRYALTNWLEFESSASFEPPVTYFHNGVAVRAQGADLAGTLRHRFYRYGFLVGARLVTGKVWRFLAGAGVGWSHRSYSSFEHLDDSQPNNVHDYQLSLADLSRDNFVASALAGVEWAAGDHWSLSLLPRYEQLLGIDSTFALSARLVFSWSWYL
jgi:hypothetical protein